MVFSDSEFEFLNFKNKLKTFRKAENNDIFFTANIIYMFNEKVLEETLEVRLCLTSYEYGTVIIADGESLRPEIVPLTFLTEYQNYRCSDEGCLIINGYSDDITDYRVFILPI